MRTKETQEFLSKNPKDEEMMTFLEKNISERHLVHDDILSIIEMLNDEENKIRAINRYVGKDVSSLDVLSSNMGRVFLFISNMKDQEKRERAEYIIIGRLEKLKDDNRNSNNNYDKKISKEIMSYIGSLEQTGEVDGKLEYIEEAKTLLNENVTIRHMIEEIDLLTFLFNVDFSRWNRQELEEYESFLTPENYQELMEMWEEAQGKETKNLIDGVIQEAKQQGIPLEDLAKEFLGAITSEGINFDNLYEWILESNEFKLLDKQRAELLIGEKEFEEKMLKNEQRKVKYI